MQPSLAPPRSVQFSPRVGPLSLPGLIMQPSLAPLRSVQFIPSTLVAGAKTRLESRIKKFTAHCVAGACRRALAKPHLELSIVQKFQPHWVKRRKDDRPVFVSEPRVTRFTPKSTFTMQRPTIINLLGCSRHKLCMGRNDFGLISKIVSLQYGGAT